MAKKTAEEISKIAHSYLEEVDPADSLMESITRRMLHMFKVGYEVAELDESQAWQAGYDEALRVSEHRIHALASKLLDVIKNRD